MLFTAGKPGGAAMPVEGREPGTFALELIHLAHHRTRPGHRRHVSLEFGAEPFGVPGTDYTEAGRETGPLTGTPATTAA